MKTENWQCVVCKHEYNTEQQARKCLDNHNGPRIVKKRINTICKVSRLSKHEKRLVMETKDTSSALMLLLGTIITPLI